ncbi:hypothetical protein CROQUDRAFT_666007 [Cronartium quercuum f. sp. fusiforme G11]|uniref:Pheromone receptor n=1 Tax=Cronartium quercuum f. sp. fusiforme G11 TaxID=708437 RepID=A0A9P6N8U8_9BASI|nr:hypothetical protein CROQUDRAFT_666007 [Cronartium quercuum f. sp. fusiforme G11]
MPSSAYYAWLVLSFLSSVINIAPTVSHLIQGHSGPASFGIWVVLVNLIDFVNALLWPEDAMDRAPIFCDISAKLTLVGPIGLLMSNCCIIRYLASIVGPNKTLQSRAATRRRIIMDYLLSFGFPAIIALASLVYQVARYEVYRLVGCSNVSALTWPAIFLSLIWPTILCGVSSGYAIYVLYWLIRQQRDLRKLVEKSRTPLNLSRFVRMCILATTYLCISAPYAIYGTVEALYDLGPYVPWDWHKIHNADNEISYVRKNPLYQLKASDWLSIIAGLTLFFFFSFANESLALYLKLFRFARLDCLIPGPNLSSKQLHVLGSDMQCAPQTDFTSTCTHEVHTSDDRSLEMSLASESRGLGLNVSKPQSGNGVHVSITQEREA